MSRSVNCAARWLLVVGGLAGAAWAAERQPNIVLILADDLGGRDLGCYGSTFHQTPNLDDLAKRGLRFTNAYSASPLCSPTRCSILTGLAPARVGITAPVCHQPEVQLEKRLVAGGPTVKVLGAESITRLKEEYVSIAEVLQVAGYRTAHFGKWHLGAEPFSPLEQGFESDLPHTPGPGPGGPNGYFAPWSYWPGEGKPQDHIEDRMSAEAARFIRENREHPFFLNYWAFSVHSPWMAKEEWTDEAARRVDPAAGQRNPMYAAMIRALDDAVGRIVKAVDDCGLADDTIFVFTSDNGGFHNPPKAAPRNPKYVDVPVTSNAPFRSGKASLYEGGTRVPMFIVWPPRVRPGASEAIVQSTDLFPTLMDLTRLTPLATVQFDGMSIAPALRGQPLGREAIFCHFPHGGDAAARNIPGFKPGSWVRRENWKLIRFFGDNDDGTDRLELYDLAKDVGETTNVAPREPELANELNLLLTKYLRDTEAVVPVRNPKYRPDAMAATAATADADPLRGWKARGCTATGRDGVLAVTSTSKTAFLGFAANMHSGTSVVRARVRTADAGTGHVDWLPGGVQTPASIVPYEVAGGEWREISVAIPAQAGLGIVRWYLPLDAKMMEIDWIEISSQQGRQVTRSDF